MARQLEYSYQSNDLDNVINTVFYLSTEVWKSSAVLHILTKYSHQSGII